MDLQNLLDGHAARGLLDVPAAVAGISVAGTRSTAVRGADALAPDTPFRIASLTKVFTCTALLLRLRADGIPTDTPAVELLADLAPEWRADRTLTVEQLLGQVSGLRPSVNAATAAGLGEGPEALHEAARLVVRGGNEREPGDRWAYDNGNYFLAGALLAALAGVPYETALQRELLAPWGLSGTGFDLPDGAVAGHIGAAPLAPASYPRPRRPSGGLWSRVPDLLALGEGLLADRALLAEMRRSRTRPDDPMRYGLGWALGPSGQMYLNGRLPGYRSALLLVPDAELVCVALAAEQDALPGLAALLSDVQRPFTGDDLAAAVDAFAA
ncbi:Beta-lactamase [Actinacidiphila yanglinensis]|uniref:Beta-lactamase n=1 Tax=Actinacidiphila yanglinensis TaxID=310779 RepID=A0A1H6D756_9ACTN|nr:serine hydrolase domain-containing protein [Actinacidiphila yanglinensis]SEG80623.1 Beta-lactamase [Actinacidiphila yanglinensis]